MDPQKGIRTHPFMPCELFFSGVDVFFNLLKGEKILDDQPEHTRDCTNGRNNTHCACMSASVSSGQDVSGLRWPGDSQRESGQFASINSCKSIRRKTSIFVRCERFARIASRQDLLSKLRCWRNLFAFRPVCCLLFLAETTFFAVFWGKEED